MNKFLFTFLLLISLIGGALGGYPYFQGSPTSEELLIEYTNVGSVDCGNPPQLTTFTLYESKTITLIATYHWCDTGAPGTIGLVDRTGKQYGPWQAVGREGSASKPNSYWEVKPNVQLPPGIYTVLDSRPETWSWNDLDNSNGRGFAFIYASTASQAGPAGQGNIIFSDDFSDTRNGWPRYSTEEVGYSYENGRYHMIAIRSQKNVYSHPSSVGLNDLDDFVLEVDTTQEGGPDNNDCGLVFRKVDGLNFYSFFIAGLGKYSFWKSVDGDWEKIIGWTESTAINVGQASNKLKIECQGDRFAFYINGIKVAEAYDDTFSSGNIDLFVGSYDVGNVHISFDNLMVYALPGGTGSTGTTGTTGTTGATGTTVVQPPQTTGNAVTVDSSSPGELTNPEGVRLDIPAGAVPPKDDGSSGTMVFTVEKNTAASPSLPSDFVPLGDIYQVGPEGFVFASPIRLTLPIPEGVDPNTVLGLTTFNATTNTWELIPGEVDVEARTVSIETTHFSPYGVFGLSGSTTADDYQKANGGWIVISNNHNYGTGGPFAPCPNQDRCRGLSLHVEHGLCIKSVVFNDPSVAASWSPPTFWQILAHDCGSSDWMQVRCPVETRYWVPAGTYRIAEYTFVSEVNHDPLYVPCSNAWSKPTQTYVIRPGDVVDFGDDVFFTGTCTTGGYPCGRAATTSVGTGDVQVTLTWYAEADIDLYVEDPTGETVSYSNTDVSSGGQLDRDNLCTNFEMGRPENIFWPENGAPEGIYKVSVNYYGDCASVGPVSWTVRTIVGGQAKTYTGTLNEVGDTQEVTTFEMS